MKRERRVKIQPSPGMSLLPDATQLESVSWTDGDKVRFDGDKLANLGGWTEVLFNAESVSSEISGYPRLLYSCTVNGASWYVIGTHTRLYGLSNGVLTNITPLDATPVAIAASLDTHFVTLGNNPVRSMFDNNVTISANAFTFTAGSNFVSVRSTILDGISAVGEIIRIAGVAATYGGIPAVELNGDHQILYFASNGFPVIKVTSLATVTGSPGTSGVTAAGKKVRIAHTAHGYVVGDTVQIAGVSGTVGGIPNTETNGIHTITALDGANAYIFETTSFATVFADGGGAAVTEARNIITVNHTAHGQLDGDRVKITDATTTGGIPDSEINAEHIIFNVTIDTYDIQLATYATSSVTAGGGANTEVQYQIAAGSANTVASYGYGLGLYGADQYGVGKRPYDPNIVVRARLWSAARYGSNIVLTPGGQTGLYQWNFDVDTAPTLVPNAPAAVNYVFTTDNIVVVLGPDGDENRLEWCDQGNISMWTAATDNQAGGQTLYDMGLLMSHANSRGTNLVFDSNGFYEMRYVAGSDYVFEFKRHATSDGIIAQNARCEDDGVAIWWGQDKWYKYDGGLVSELLLADGSQSPIRQYVYDRLTATQRDKIFMGVERAFNEVWAHYPSNTSANEYGYNEVDSYWVYQKTSPKFYKGTLDRSAREYPNKIEENLLMIAPDGRLYQHEVGNDDNGAAMNWYVDTNYIMAGEGDAHIEITGVEPDSVQTGTMLMTISTKRFAQGGNTVQSSSKTITADTQRIDFRAYGKQRKYRIQGSGLNSGIKIGHWTEILKQGGAR